MNEQAWGPIQIQIQSLAMSVAAASQTLELWLYLEVGEGHLDAWLEDLGCKSTAICQAPEAFCCLPQCQGVRLVMFDFGRKC